jgi:16S rRNA (uracil1498-N3)-methyltransferase
VSTPPLFLVDDLPVDGLSVADQVVLSGDEGRHAARVRRMRVGERVSLGDGRGSVLDCRISAVHQDGLVLDVAARRFEQPPAPRLVVVQALAKGDRGELAVETMTELGVDEIVPWAAARSVTEWHGPRGERALQRWRRAVREAAKQSRRAWMPTIADLADDAAVARRLGAAHGIVLHEAATASLADHPVAGSSEIVLVVGPEGGIGDGELDRFTAAGAVALRMGPAVLRTSTAGAAALTALSVRLGRWS